MNPNKYFNKILDLIEARVEEVESEEELEEVSNERDYRTFDVYEFYGKEKDEFKLNFIEMVHVFSRDIGRALEDSGTDFIESVEFDGAENNMRITILKTPFCIWARKLLEDLWIRDAIYQNSDNVIELHEDVSYEGGEGIE